VVAKVPPKHAAPPAPLVRAGEIVSIYLHSARHDKFLICICPQALKFISINSAAWPMDPAAQLQVTPADFGFLTHTSFISVGQPIRLTTLELNVLTTAPQRRLGVITAQMATKIKAAAAKSVTLTGVDKTLIDSNL